MSLTFKQFFATVLNHREPRGIRRVSISREPWKTLYTHGSQLVALANAIVYLYGVHVLSRSTPTPHSKPCLLKG